MFPPAVVVMKMGIYYEIDVRRGQAQSVQTVYEPPRWTLQAPILHGLIVELVAQSVVDQDV